MRLITFVPPEAAERGDLVHRVGVLQGDAVLDRYAAVFADAVRRGLDADDARARAARQAPKNMVAFFESADDGRGFAEQRRRRARKQQASAYCGTRSATSNAPPAGAGLPTYTGAPQVGGHHEATEGTA
jgi:hypothetical protein